MDGHRYTKKLIGPFRCRNCNSMGYYDYVMQKDICYYCGNPDLDKGIGQEIDSTAAEAITCCAMEELERAEQLILECKKTNRKAVPTRLAEIAYAVVRDWERPDVRRAERTKYRSEARALMDRFLKPDGMVDAQENRFFLTMYSHNDSDALALLLSIYDLIASQVSASEEDPVRESEKAVSEKLEKAPEDSETPGIHTMMEQRAWLCYDMLIPESLETFIGRNIVMVQALEKGDWVRAKVIAQTAASCIYGGSFKGRALQLILRQYPPEEGKMQLLSQIADRESLNLVTARWILGYLQSTQDPTGIRMEIVRRSAAANAFLGVGAVKYLLPDARAQGLEDELFEIICSAPSQVEQLEALRYLLEAGKVNELNGLLDAMLKSSRRPSIQADLFHDFLLRMDLGGSDKASVLSRIMSMPGGTLLKRGITRTSLCEALDHMEDRLKVLDVILTPERPIDPRTGEAYILHCSQDGEGKVEIVRKMAAAGFRILAPEQFRERYLSESADDEKTCLGILDVLNLNKKSPGGKGRRSRFLFW